MLASALSAFYSDGNEAGIENYSKTALARVWNAERFSWWFTGATHRLSDNSFDQRIQAAELDFSTTAASALASLSQNYIGMPVVDPVTGGRLV
jgi:p-hydroxybenzoate 3-monooxygenase